MHVDVLKVYRDRHDLTQAELAKKLEVSRSLVAALETGAKPYSVEMALRIEARLGIDRAEILPKVFKREPELGTAPAT